MGFWTRTAALHKLDALGSFEPQVEAWVDRSHLYPVDATGVRWPLGLTREYAMRVPAVARARHLIAGTIADLPMRALRGAELVEPQPSWAFVTDGQLGDLPAEQRRRLGLLVPQSPWYRMLWTVDDLLFYGLSCWYVTAWAAEEVTGRRFPLRLARIPYEFWDIDEDTAQVTDIDGRPLDQDRVRLIPGAHSGLLDFGRDSLAAAARLERTAADVAAHPFRLELHQTTDVRLDDDERRTLITEARAALNAYDGIIWTNSAVETKDHALDSGELLIAGRNAAALDVARHASIPAAMIDATTEGASLEYSTLEGRNQQWIDYGLVIYMDPVEARLGMDDVTPAGQRIAFDTADLTAPAAAPTGPVTED